MNYQLLAELRDISKDQWFGLPYGSFHHPLFSLEGSTYGGNVLCQRDTKKRFKQVDLTTKELTNKTVVDVGSNTGAMLLYAAQLGANKVIGIDNHKPNTIFCQKLFNECEPNLSAAFYNWDANRLKDDALKELNPDIVFCLALSKWVDYEHLIKLLSNSGAELIWFEDNKYGGQDRSKGLIPGYECKLMFYSGMEANTPNGWQRSNYLGRKIK
jgi:hypothetical protein